MPLKTVLFTVALVVANTTALTSSQSTNSTEGKQSAIACELASQSDGLREQYPLELERSTLLAVEAIRRDRRLETDAALRASLDLLQKPTFVLELSQPARVLRFSHNGRWLLMGSKSGKLTLVDIKAGTLQYEWPTFFDGGIMTVDFSPDDRHIAVGTSKGRVQVFDVKSHSEVTHFIHRASVNVVTFSPNGHRLASGSDDHSVRIFDFDNANGHPIQMIHKDKVTALAFSPEGEDILSASADGCAIVFEEATGIKIAEPPCKQTINAVAFGKDVFATASNDHSVRVFGRFTKGEPLQLIHQDVVKSISFNSDGRYLVTGSTDGSARVYRSGNGEELARLNHKSSVNAVTFSPNGLLIATASSDYTARIFEWQTKRELARFLLNSPVNAISFHPDGKSLAVAASDDPLRMYPVTDKHEILRLVPEASVLSVDLSPNFDLLTIGSDDNRIWTYGPSATKSWNKLTNGPPLAVAFSADGSLVASGDDVSVRIFNSNSGKLLKQATHDNSVQALAFSGNGKWVATASVGQQESYAHILNSTIAGKDIFEPIKHDSDITSMALNMNGDLIATGSIDTEVRIFLLPSEKQLPIPAILHDNAVTAVTFSKDGKLLATGSTDRTAKVVDVNTGKNFIFRHPSEVASVTFSHDSHWLATGATDGFVRIFDLQTGRQVAQINNYLRGIRVVRFSEDDRFIATVALGPELVSVRRYMVTPEQMTDDACSRLSRNLTREEWSQYIPDEPQQKTCKELP